MRKLVLVAMLFGGCIDDLPPRVCSTDGDCVRGGAPGRCRTSTVSSTQWCTFTAPECAGGERWGLLAGDELAESCVLGPTPDAAGSDAGSRDGAIDDAPIVVDGPVYDASIYDARITDGPPDSSVPVPDARPAVLSSQPTAVSFGSVTVGMTKTVPVEIHNDGGLATGNLTVGISGTDAARFSVASDLCNGRTLAAGGVCTLSVVFSPTGAAGDRTALLSVGDGAASVMLSLNGTGVAAGTVAIEVSPGTLTVTEGMSASFQVNLSAQPPTSQTVMVMSTNTAAATVSTSSLTFTTVNWAQSQPVMVTAVEDVNLINDSVSIRLTNANMPTQTVSVTATDNDTQRVVVAKADVTVKESGAGNSTPLGVTLAFMPSTNVTVNVVSSNTSVATVTPATLTFRPDNYATAQPITITGVPDVDLVNAMTTVTLGATGATGASVSVTSEDVDTLAIVASTSSLGVVEGQSNTFNVHLSNQPTMTTVLDVASDKTGVATVNQPQLTFTMSNWNVDQPVTVNGVSDGNAVDDTATITVSRSGLVSKTVAVTVDDINCASDCDCTPTTYCGAGNLCESTELSRDTFGFVFSISPPEPYPWSRIAGAGTTINPPQNRNVRFTFEFCLDYLSGNTVLGMNARVLIDGASAVESSFSGQGVKTFDSVAPNVPAGTHDVVPEVQGVRISGPYPGPTLNVSGAQCGATTTLVTRVERTTCP